MKISTVEHWAVLISIGLFLKQIHKTTCGESKQNPPTKRTPFYIYIYTFRDGRFGLASVFGSVVSTNYGPRFDSISALLSLRKLLIYGHCVVTLPLTVLNANIKTAPTAAESFWRWQYSVRYSIAVSYTHLTLPTRR